MITTMMTPKKIHKFVTKLKYRLLEKLYVILIELCYLPVLKGNNSYSNAWRTNNLKSSQKCENGDNEYITEEQKQINNPSISQLLQNLHT